MLGGLLVTPTALAQSNPAAFALSGGSFTFTSQTATSTTYPTNMQGWATGTNNVAVLPTAAPLANQVLVASGAAGTSGLSNLGTNGFNFLSTGSSPNQQVGALALALNTTGRASVLVSWTAADQTAGTTRQMNMTLQYRLGTSGTFTTVTSSTYTTSNTSQATATNFSNIALPSACNNQPVVQLRWITYESPSQSGSRDAIRLDEITVASSLAPVITGATTAASFTTTYGTASAVQAFSVSAVNMTADLVATAPAGFEVSSDATTYGGTATFTQSAGSVSGTLSVRLSATAPVSGTYNSQNIVLSTTGATSVNIVTAASGNFVTAKGLSITASAQNKTYGSALSLGTSFFSSVGLANSETIGSVTLASSGSAAAAPATTYAITPSAATGGTFATINYNITYNDGTLTVDPKVLTITADPVTKAFGDTLASPVTGSTAFTSDGLVGSETIGSVTITYGTGAAASDSVGPYPNQVTPSSAVGGTFNIANYAPAYVSSTLTVTAAPTISVTGVLAAVDTTYGTPSASSSSFAVSGIFLTGNLTVTPPAGFEVSTSIGSGYSTSLNLPASGTLSSTPVYVRLAATTAFGSYSGNVTVSGGGATSQTVATASSSVAKKALTITGLTGDNKPYDGTVAATTSGTPQYVGLENSEIFTVTGTASATFASTGAGMAKPITVTGYTAPSANYSVSQPSGLSADIAPVILTITAPTIADKVYSGTTTPGILTVGTLSGFVGSETVTATGSVANYSSPNVGAYTGNVITYTLQDGSGGGLAANYSLANGTADGTITPRTLTITASSVFKDVGATLTGGAGSTAFTSIGLVTPETIGSVTIAYGTGAAVGDAVGVYPGQVTPSAATDGTFTPTNYVISYVTGDITVTAPLIAGWDFQTTTNGGTAATAAPGSPTTYTANLGTGTIFMDGTNGSSAWTSLASNPQLTSFGGTAVNASSGFSTSTSGASSLVVANSTANGKSIVFKFSMTGRAGLMVSYATQKTTTGFSSQLWEYSINGTTWTTAETIGSIPSSYATVSLATITALDRAPSGYLRLTVSGATSSTGNNRLDNIQIRAGNVPAIEFVGTVAAFTTTYGSPSAEQTFVISGLNLSDDITATAPSGFEVSSDGVTYASTATFTESGGEASGSLRIRLEAAAPVSGSYDSQNVVLSSAPAPSVNITTLAAGNVVSKATPTIITAPTASAITSGQTLASSSLTGGAASLSGTFAFTTPGTAPGVGTANQDVTFTPTDTANYNNATTTVSVTVNASGGPDPLFTDPTMNAALSDPSAGVKRLSFTGIPGRIYGIQRSAALSGWIQIDTVTAPGSGAVTFDDPSPLPGTGFYRIIYPAE